MVIATVCLAAVLAACPDRNPAAPRPRGEPRAQVARGPLVFTQTATIECRRRSDSSFACANVTAASASRGRPGAPRAKPAVVIPPKTTPAYFAMNGENYQWSVDTLSIDRRVVNWLGQSMGTLNDTTATGLKVFEWEPPVTTIGSGQVTLLPGDGSEAFRTDTTGTQTYFSYNGILPAKDTSAARTWRYVVPHTVQVFHSTVGISAEIPAEANVTLAAVDSTPSWFNADSMTGNGYVRNVISVIFSPSTSLADRQLAVAFVGASIVGGLGGVTGEEGVYYFYFPAASSGVQMDSAVARIKALPSVRSAAFVILTPPAYRRPRDDSLWRTWRLRPSDSMPWSPNWGMESIRAPLAWGCSVGGSATAVLVIDHTFDSTEVLNNVPGTWPTLAKTDTLPHGTWVSATLESDNLGQHGGALSHVLGGGWVQDTTPFDTSMREGGATLSAFGLSHESDSSVRVDVVSSANDGTVPAGVQRIRAILNDVNVIDSLDVTVGSPGPTGCANLENVSGVCVDSLRLPPIELIRSVVVAFPQNGGGIVIAENRYAATTEVYSDTGSDDLGVLHTLTSAVYHWVPTVSRVFALPTQGSALTLTDSLVDSAVFRVALAETGDEVAVSVGRDSVSIDYGWRDAGGRTTLSCYAEFRPVPYGSPAQWGAALSTPKISDAGMCPDPDGVGFVFGGTFAPIVATSPEQAGARRLYGAAARHERVLRILRSKRRRR